jgi:hypothetical protein
MALPPGLKEKVDGFLDVCKPRHPLFYMSTIIEHVPADPTPILNAQYRTRGEGKDKCFIRWKYVGTTLFAMADTGDDGWRTDAEAVYKKVEPHLQALTGNVLTGGFTVTSVQMRSALPCIVPGALLNSLNKHFNTFTVYSTGARFALVWRDVPEQINAVDVLFRRVQEA